MDLQIHESVALTIGSRSVCKPNVPNDVNRHSPPEQIELFVLLLQRSASYSMAGIIREDMVIFF